jgi:glycosyltransferase involved in cell wall biosynthesis
VKISIALATYNGARYLAAQLQSYLDQERMPDELVVSDDGSVDETCALINSFAKSAPFDVRLVRHEVQLGYVGNFNRALTMSSGDLVFLSDQDDLWLPEKISQVATLAEKHPGLLLVMNDAAITEGDLTATNLTKLGQLRSAGYPDSAFVMGCCCAIRRELLDLCLPIPEGARGHDNWIVDFSSGLEATFILEKALQLYRRHESNESVVIANSTRPINRRDRLKLQLGRAFSSGAEDSARTEIQYLEELRSGCSRALGRPGENFDARISRYDSILEQQLEMLQFRRELRSEVLYRRVFKVLRFWLSGGYREADGFRSMIRDLMG